MSEDMPEPLDDEEVEALVRLAQQPPEDPTGEAYAAWIARRAAEYRALPKLPPDDYSMDAELFSDPGENNEHLTARLAAADKLAEAAKNLLGFGSMAFSYPVQVLRDALREYEEARNG